MLTFKKTISITLLLIVLCATGFANAEATQSEPEPSTPEESESPIDVDDKELPKETFESDEELLASLNRIINQIGDM